MDFGGILVLAVVWLLFNLLGAGKRPPRAERKVPAQPGPPPAGTADPTQQEGTRLEQLLRELERNMEGVAGAPSTGGSRLPSPKRAPAPPLPPSSGEEEDVEERGSLEQPERVISLENEVHRPARARYAHDEEAQEVARRRVERARSRDQALSKVDHAAFDARIRREPTDHTEVRRYTPTELRNAIVWREILGPPVSERDR